MDSKSAIDLSLDPVAFKKTKHIMRACYFVRDHVARQRFKCTHVPGKTNVADIFTKSVARPTFHELMRAILQLMGAKYERKGS